MNEHGKFWAVINLTVFGSLVLIVSISTNYWKDHNTKIVNLIESGVPAVEAMCAMQDDYGKNPTCIVIAAKQK